MLGTENNDGAKQQYALNLLLEVIYLLANVLY